MQAQHNQIEIQNQMQSRKSRRQILAHENASSISSNNSLHFFFLILLDLSSSTVFSLLSLLFFGIFASSKFTKFISLLFFLARFVLLLLFFWCLRDRNHRFFVRLDFVRAEIFRIWEWDGAAGPSMKQTIYKIFFL